MRLAIVDEMTLTLDINPKCGKMHWPSPDDPKKVWNLYVSLMVLEISLLTLLMGVSYNNNIY